MNMFGIIDLGELFGTEVRVQDGEECLYIPLRFNRSIRFFGGRPTLMLDIIQTKKPDENNFTHICAPHIPRNAVTVLSEADRIKMTTPIGKFRVYDNPRRQEPAPGRQQSIGYETLASNPVKKNDIPI